MDDPIPISEFLEKKCCDSDTQEFILNNIDVSGRCDTCGCGVIDPEKGYMMSYHYMFCSRECAYPLDYEDE